MKAKQLRKETLLKYARQEIRNLKNVLSERQKRKDGFMVINANRYKSVYDLLFIDSNGRNAMKLKYEVSNHIDSLGRTPLEIIMKNNEGTDYNKDIVRFIKKDEITELKNFRGLVF